jgi:hypothetical protein
LAKYIQKYWKATLMAHVRWKVRRKKLVKRKGNKRKYKEITKEKRLI